MQFHARACSSLAEIMDVKVGRGTIFRYIFPAKNVLPARREQGSKSRSSAVSIIKLRPFPNYRNKYTKFRGWVGGMPERHYSQSHSTGAAPRPSSTRVSNLLN